MNYDQLDKTYKEKQSKRISEKSSALGEGRRLKAAILFLDISAFTSRHLDTEQEQNNMLSMFNLFFSEMIKIAEDYGGTVEKNTGDGLLAYFEDESGCKRAVACAQTMFATNQTLIAPIFEANHIEPFIFRISISYGYITVARIGPLDCFNQYVAIGSEANYAAKMLASALPNEIIISEPVKNALPVEWQTRYIGSASTDPIIPYTLYKFTGRWV